MRMFAAIEAGGTKFVLAVADDNLDLVKRVSIPTTTPEETFDAIYELFDQYEVKSFGVGSFGPIDVNEKSDTYGYITSTPKPHWAQTDFVGRLKDRYQVPVAWTTDVNAAAYGELKQGAAKDVDNCIYITVGTGIGAGVVIDNQVIHGYQHPEAGHILVRKHAEDAFEGACPFHGDCLEGLACGPAIEKRWNQAAIELADNAKVWEIQAYYLAQALYSLYLTTSTERFILGGGVMKQRQLFPLIRQYFQDLNQDYVNHPDLASFIVPPALEDNAGISGCFELAREVAK